MIYLNNASTTKTSYDVLNDFIWCAKEYWFNPSDTFQKGLDTKKLIYNAQVSIAKCINSKPDEIIFTSGGSESNNWAIKGYLDKNRDVKHIITTTIEHPSVYNTCKYLKDNFNINVHYVDISNDGCVKLNELEILTKKYPKSLVSIMMANNEIGTIQPVKEISKIVHKYDCILHMDCVQSFCHIPIDVNDMGIDMISTSFHKIKGLKNCGFLYIKNGIELTPLIHGGNQFGGKRSGTENVPTIYAFGRQVERINVLDTYDKEKEIRNYLWDSIRNKCSNYEIYLNGSVDNRLPNNLSLTFKGINAEQLITLMDLRGYCFSAGSACCSGEPTPSRVLKAIGLSDEDAFSTVRITISDNNTIEELDKFVNDLEECLKALKSN